MSTTETTEETTGAAKTGTWVDRVPRAPKAEQTPWLKPEDAEGWTTIHRGVGRPHVRRRGVEVGVDGDAAQPQPTAAPHHPEGDLAAVRDQDRAEGPAA